MEDGTPYIVMELLSGQHLAQLLDERGSWLTLADVEALVEQMAEALSQIHQFDIVHRDIKAENVCVVRSVPLLVKLIDFGVSKVPDMPGSAVLTEPGTLVGSAEYMSPEQIVNAATVDHMADLWAMAVLVYLALLFELPFHGADLADVFTAIRRGQYRRPTLLRPELPPALDDFFARAFHPKRAERFLSATEMASAFNEAIGDALLSVPPANRTRTYVLVTLGALVLIAVVILLAR
jgi:serine/threonine-protein kinase